MFQDKVKNRLPIEVELRKGNYGYFNIAEQWNAMLSDPDASDWGEKYILSLLDKIDAASEKDDTLNIFNTPEWKAIVDRRGPVEAAWKAKCTLCGMLNIGFGTSGFVDEYYTVDYERKTITWRSIYAENASPVENSLCGKCGKKLHNKECISPFAAIKGFTVIRT
jgi:hypothetical protein